jgi:preprotein translocase subunit SecE
MRPLFEYLSASRAELAKVAWPSRRQTVRLTFVVIVFSLVIAVIIGTLDYLFSLGLQKLIS